MVVSGWNKNRHVPEGILNPFGNKLNEKFMQHGSPRCYTMRCAEIPSTARKLPQKHRRLKYSMLPISNWPGSIFFSSRKWLRHTNHNTTHDIHTLLFCARLGPYSVGCAKTSATTLIIRTGHSTGDGLHLVKVSDDDGVQFIDQVTKKLKKCSLCNAFYFSWLALSYRKMKGGVFANFGPILNIFFEFTSSKHCMNKYVKYVTW